MALVTDFLTENRAHKASPSITSKDHMTRFEVSSLYAESADDIVSQARLHIDLTISRNINIYIYIII